MLYMDKAHADTIAAALTDNFGEPWKAVEAGDRT